ncbi:MAG TPA: CoA transferase [Dehalococcoidia bacterium]|nr:CoA transferase [Dehalococcoidia bacterium]
MTTMPLEGVRVIDLTRYTAGPFCTRILGDYGADVIKIEAPEGDPGRQLPPFVKDEPGTERSGTFLFLNTNKRSVILDLTTAEGRERLLDLVRTAQVVVENFAPGTMERLGLGYDILAEANPRIVLTSLSNFGQEGPYRDWLATDLTVYAMAGPMLATGNIEHEPVRVAGRMATYQTAYMAALATVVAVQAAELRGRGEHVDVSMLEALTNNVDMRLTQLQAYQYSGRIGTRSGLASLVGSGVFPCADGYVQLTGGLQGRLILTMRMIGCEELMERPEWQAPGAPTDPERIEEFLAYLLPWTLSHTKREIRDACELYGVLGAPLNTVADMLTDPNFVAREFFQTIDHPSTGPAQYPGWHFRMHTDEGPMPPRRRAPLLGEHTDEVLAELSPRPTTPATGEDRLGDRLPLEGLRVIDFTVVWAGPYATMHLADWGAEVIRIESRQHLAPNTRGQLAHMTRAMVANNPAAASWYPDGEPGADPWNRNALFNGHGRGKKSMTIDLSRPEGQEQFERLVAQADALIENNLPPNIEKQGITWERLSKINPRLVLVRVPAFGLEGPYRAYRTLGNHMESIAGHPVIRAYPDLSLEYAPTGVPADAASGIGGATALLLGIRYRDRTGKGLMMELATAENMVGLLGEFVMDYTINGREWEHMGNDHWWLAPHNVYPCQGDDTWVTIAARNDEEWRALCGVMLRPDLASDPRFIDNANRHAHRRELDRIIGAWTVNADARWIMHRLQAAGVPAGVVNTEPGILADPQHRARDFFQEIEHPSTGRQLHPRRAWRASRTPERPMRHPPRLGEDNEYVYRELLGFSEERYQEWVASGHIGMAYEDSVP